jgi:hypothetical protein
LRPLPGLLRHGLFRKHLLYQERRKPKAIIAELDRSVEGFQGGNHAAALDDGPAPTVASAGQGFVAMSAVRLTARDITWAGQRRTARLG